MKMVPHFTEYKFPVPFPDLLYQNLQDLLKFAWVGTSLVVQWLRLHAPNAGGTGLIPGQGTRSHMPQLRPDVA